MGDPVTGEPTMNDTARRLRAAMREAVGDAQPPANLLAMVGRRHRRHRARTAVACAAVIVAGALGLPPAAAALRGGAPSGRPATSPGPAPAPRAAPGTVLDPCNNQIAETLPRDWRGESVQASPVLRAGPSVWFVGMRQQTATFYRKLAVGGLLVQVADGSTAEVKVVGPANGHFRFLFGPRDFVSGVDARYTLKDGENGVTFVGCPSRADSSPVPGYTQFGGYFLVDRVPLRVSFDVWTAASRRPALVTFVVGR
jgi:hypothetical protein